MIQWCIYYSPFFIDLRINKGMLRLNFHLNFRLNLLLNLRLNIRLNKSLQIEVLQGQSAQSVLDSLRREPSQSSPKLSVAEFNYFQLKT